MPSIACQRGTKHSPSMIDQPIRTADDALSHPSVIEAIRRRVIEIDGARIRYSLAREKDYEWGSGTPEEWVRAVTVAWLIVEKGYPSNRIDLEVVVPRRTPSDFADIVVYEDDKRSIPYLVVENKPSDQKPRAKKRAIEQGFGNANSLRARFLLYDEGGETILFDVANHPPTERSQNRIGVRERLPREYGNAPRYSLIAGTEDDIVALDSLQLEGRVRRTHSLIWAGGRRDPLTAFDEWSKLLFAKVHDERTTHTGDARRFQVGTNETSATIANRIHHLFSLACQSDSSIFPLESGIALPDPKVAEVVQVLQDVAFTRTDVDTIGEAFEQFFGSVFRGGLGQYFTMRQLTRFIVAVLDITHEDYILDPTAGSGGFLLECLLQVWESIDLEFTGQPDDQVQRVKFDFANDHVFGIEVHEILARICKINLLLHHDGHTNIEGNRSTLDSSFTNPRLDPVSGRFSAIVGNPPFGTNVVEGDDEQLGTNELRNFQVATGVQKIDSEHVILERCIDFLEPGGRLGLVVPDGLLNNQSNSSNCPRVRRHIASRGRITSIISLPDHAFRKSGAQNKTSIIFFQKFSEQEQRKFDNARSHIAESTEGETQSFSQILRDAGLRYSTFLGEANDVGYSSIGVVSSSNDLYASEPEGTLAPNQSGTILGEWRKFITDPASYKSSMNPNCTAIPFDQIWDAHTTHRLDPKYHLFKEERSRPIPNGWKSDRLGRVLMRRLELPEFTVDPNREFTVMTISQTGEIRPREAGKGRNPPEWRASYFDESPGTWYVAREGDVVFSSIDLWKGCIALVPTEFDGSLVSKEFPIYRVRDEQLLPAFLQILLRSRHYQRAFRAITTGHSNRRRTQVSDFEALEISFPVDIAEQRRLIKDIRYAQSKLRNAVESLENLLTEFSALVDGRSKTN